MAANTPILSQAQAEAVYSAMCAMNNVGGKAYDLRFRREIVSTDFRGLVRVYGPDADELYEDQHAFATAYGLNKGA